MMQWCSAMDTHEPLDINRYREPLLGHIRSIVKSPIEAEDLLQEVFIRPHQGIEQLQAEAALLTWLFRIASQRMEVWTICASVGVSRSWSMRSSPTTLRLAAISAAVITAAEIAAVLELTMANVKLRLHRARARLKAALELGCVLSCDCRGVLVCEPREN